MPLNPGVFSQLEPTENAVDRRNRALALRMQYEAARQLEEDRRMKLEAASRDLQDERAVRTILQRHGGDLARAVPEVMAAAPAIGLKLREQLEKSDKARVEARKAAADAMKGEIETARARTEYGVSLLRGLGESPHPEVYRMVRQQIVGIDPDLADIMPEAYDRTAVESLQGIGLKASEFYDRQQKGLDRAAKGEWRKGIGTVLSTAQSEEDWDEMRAAFQALGVPEAELRVFGEFGPEAAARAELMSMTPEERSQAAARASEARKREMEMAGTLPMSPYQKAQVTGDEAQRRIAAGHLAVARQREAREQAAEAKGRQPFGRAAGGGRAVTSGDANRMAEFRTAIDDVQALSATLSGSGATGVSAKIGAGTPKWITDLTGFGTEAKQKQAVIDRVKQVIGKTLEGGVLRKEDEIKYEKILPTIDDTAAVAASKLEGLREALDLRMERQLEALEDAGYDTSRYRGRSGSEPGAGARGVGGESRYERYLRQRGR